MQQRPCSRLFLLSTVLLLGWSLMEAEGARPSDALFLQNFNQTFKIQDEVYQFRLVPVFKVGRYVTIEGNNGYSSSSVVTSSLVICYISANDRLGAVEFEETRHLHWYDAGSG